MKLRPGIISTLGTGGGGGGGGGTVGAPTYVWKSTFRASIGDISNIMPSVLAQEGDVMLMFVENGGNDAAVGLPSGGWSHITNSPVADTSGSSTQNTRLHCFWKRFIAGDASPNWDIPDGDDHECAIILGFRNVKTTGNPWDATPVASTAGSATTAISITGLTTTLANCLIVVAASTSIEADSTTEFSGWTNASLASITEASDDTTNAGDGGGIGTAYGVKTAAGVVSTTTATAANAQRHAYLCIALAPAS